MQEVLKVMKKFEISKATGIEKLSIKLLKKGTETLPKSISDICIF